MLYTFIEQSIDTATALGISAHATILRAVEWRSIGLCSIRPVSLNDVRSVWSVRGKLVRHDRNYSARCETFGGDFLEFQNWFLPLPHKRGRKRFLPSERGGLSVKDGLQKKFFGGAGVCVRVPPPPARGRAPVLGSAT
jgi:hypothetical protein